VFKVESLCENYTLRKFTTHLYYEDHSPKDYKVFTILFTVNLHILFLQGFLFLFTYDSSISSNPTNNMKLLNANYESKFLISTLNIFEGKKWMNNRPHSF